MAVDEVIIGHGGSLQWTQSTQRMGRHSYAWEVPSCLEILWAVHPKPLVTTPVGDWPRTWRQLGGPMSAGEIVSPAPIHPIRYCAFPFEHRHQIWSTNSLERAMTPEHVQASMVNFGRPSTILPL